MSLLLTWENPNTVPVSTNVYRGDTPLDRKNPGTPIVTLTEGETSYLDKNTIQGKTYYYMLEVFNEKDRYIGFNIPIQAVNRRGAGTNIITYGDEELGVMGKVPTGDFITPVEIFSQLGITGMGTNNPTGWYKYTYKGKVLFVPVGYLSNTVTWSLLYANGLVYGDGSTSKWGYVPSGNGVPQKRTVTFGGDEYIVRLPTGWGGSLASDLPVASGVDESPLENEFDLFFTPLHKPVPNNQRFFNLDVMATAPFSVGFMVQETVGAKPLMRGRQFSTTNPLSDTTAFTYHGTFTNLSTSSYWIPILELVEDRS